MEGFSLRAKKGWKKEPSKDYSSFFRAHPASKPPQNVKTILKVSIMRKRQYYHQSLYVKKGPLEPEKVHTAFRNLSIAEWDASSWGGKENALVNHQRMLLNDVNAIWIAWAARRQWGQTLNKKKFKAEQNKFQLHKRADVKWTANIDEIPFEMKCLQMREEQSSGM